MNLSSVLIFSVSLCVGLLQFKATGQMINTVKSVCEMVTSQKFVECVAKETTMPEGTINDFVKEFKALNACPVPSDAAALNRVMEALKNPIIQNALDQIASNLNKIEQCIAAA